MVRLVFVQLPFMVVGSLSSNFYGIARSRREF